MAAELNPVSQQGCCIFATRIAIDVAHYFGITATPLPVLTIIANPPFTKHVVEDGFIPNLKQWNSVDGSYSVVIGLRDEKERIPPNHWNGHLIAVAQDTFGDFSIQAVERPQHQIITGPALVAPYPRWPAWQVSNPHGTVFFYERTNDTRYRDAPDWKDPKRRRPMVGRLIRDVRNTIAKTEFVPMAGDWPRSQPWAARPAG
jgi:hypothetical protein